MNIQVLHNLVQQQRENEFSSSPQLSLGELITEIELAGVKKEDGEDKTVDFDFGTAVPTGLSSWRGAYDELALGYKLTGRDSVEHLIYEKKASDLLSELKDAIGKKYCGWKGGYYTMKESTPVWVANSGNSGNTAIVGVLDDGFRLVLITAYCEY